MEIEYESFELKPEKITERTEYTWIEYGYDFRTGKFYQRTILPEKAMSCGKKKKKTKK